MHHTRSSFKIALSLTLGILLAGGISVFASSLGNNLFVTGTTGIASTSPWGLLSVNPSGVTGPEFVVGSSTRTHFVITSGGNVGLGTTSPGARLDIKGSTSNDTADAVNVADSSGTRIFRIKNNGYVAVGANAITNEPALLSIGIDLTNPNTDGYQTMVGMLPTITHTVGSLGQYIGYDSGFSVTGAGTLDNSTGVVGFLANNAYSGAGTITSASGISGFYATPSVSNGTVGNVYNYRGQFSQFSGTITNGYGIYLANPAKSGGTLTNNYGMYLESQTAGSNNYAIYSAGGKSYLAGNLGIGTTTPNWLLQVSGTRPSLALSDSSQSGGQNLRHWLFSSMGGNLYIGTSTDAYGTSTPAALTLSNNGRVGVGTSSPASTLSIEGVSTATTTLQIGNKQSTTKGSCIQLYTTNGEAVRLYATTTGTVAIWEAGSCQ